MKINCVIKAKDFSELLVILIYFKRFDYNVTYEDHYLYVYEGKVINYTNIISKNVEPCSWDEYKLKNAEEFI